MNKKPKPSKLRRACWNQAKLQLREQCHQQQPNMHQDIDQEHAVVNRVNNGGKHIAALLRASSVTYFSNVQGGKRDDTWIGETARTTGWMLSFCATKICCPLETFNDALMLTHRIIEQQISMGDFMEHAQRMNSLKCNTLRVYAMRLHAYFNYYLHTHSTHMGTCRILGACTQSKQLACWCNVDAACTVPQLTHMC